MFTTTRCTTLSRIVVTVVFFASARVYGQVALVDDIVIVSQGQRQKERARTDSHLGLGARQSDSLLGPSPGSGETVWGQSPETTAAQPALAPPRDVAAAASAPPGRAIAMRQPVLQPPTGLPPVQALPIYGPLEIPALDELGPSDGLTLDAAINQLLSANYDLRAKYQEIPKAQSALLSAGLRNNPLLFASADNVPYGSYSEARPGENSYGVTVIQPFDLNHKRGARVAVATRARRVIEAQYQDACRQEIDTLYTAFVDLLAAREALRYANAGLRGFDAVVATTQKLVQGQEEARIEIDRMEVREAASIALEQAHLALDQAKQNVALLLNIPDAAAEQLEVYGTIRESPVDVPPVDDLVGLALQLRPDLAAFRLGIGRAQAEVQLARREAIPDFFLLYTPYGQRINSPLGAQNATSWGIGGFTSIPLLNRNQGNIARARQTVAQTRIETAGVERRIATEVRQAHLGYLNAKAAVERLEGAVLHRARHVRDVKYGLLTKGQERVLAFLDAQREYNEIVRQYRETLVRRRRSILKLNTVVGQRLFP